MASTQLSPNIEESFEREFERSPLALVISDDSTAEAEARIADFIDWLDGMDDKDMWPKGLSVPIRVLVSHDGTSVLDLGYRQILSVADAHLGSKASKELLWKILDGIGVTASLFEKIKKETTDTYYHIAISRERVMVKQDDKGRTIHVVRLGEGPATGWTSWAV